MHCKSTLWMAENGSSEKCLNCNNTEFVKNRLGLHASKEDLVRQLLPPCHLVNGVRKKYKLMSEMF